MPRPSPILFQKSQDELLARKAGIPKEKFKKKHVLKESDPLFVVLKEDQVGIDPITGRPRIDPDVLEGMRQYLRVSSEAERLL